MKYTQIDIINTLKKIEIQKDNIIIFFISFKMIRIPPSFVKREDDFFEVIINIADLIKVNIHKLIDITKLFFKHELMEVI